MRKRFTMSVQFANGVKTTPATYEFVAQDGEWLLYRTVDTHAPLNITDRCISDFINDGIIYDVQY